MNVGMRKYVLFKAIALYTILAVLFPLEAFLGVAVFKLHIGLADFLILLFLVPAGLYAAWLFGHGERDFTHALASAKPVRMMLGNRSKSAFVSKLLVNISILVPALAVLFLYPSGSFPAGVFRAVFALAVYLVSIKSFNVGFENIMSIRLTFVGMGVLVFCLIFSSYYKPMAYVRTGTYILAYAYMILSLVLHNQRRLEMQFMKKESDRTSSIPANIRSYNMKLVLIFFALVLLFFNFQPVMVFILNTVKDAAKWVALMIVKLINLFGRGSRNTGGMSAGTDSSRVDVMTGGTIGNPYARFIKNVATYFLIIYFCYRVFLFLWNRVKKSIAEALKELARKLFKRNTVNAADGEFEDEVEIIKEKAQDEARKPRKSRKKMRNPARDLRKIIDPAERVRYYYGYILELLVSKGVKLDKTDTPREILDKGFVPAAANEYMNPVTSVYEQVRYGDTAPDPASLGVYEDDCGKAEGVIKSIKKEDGKDRFGEPIV